MESISSEQSIPIISYPQLERRFVIFPAAYDAFSNHPPCADSERIYIVAREQHQENKLYL